MKKSTRLPGDLLWIILWMLLAGGLSLFVAVVAPTPGPRILYGAIAALYLCSAMGLYRMTQWARVLAGITMLLGAVIQIIGFRKGFDWGRTLRLVMNLYWGAYLLLPSTRQMFAQSAGASFSRIGCLLELGTMFLVFASVGVSVYFKLPGKVWIPVTGVIVCTFLFFQDRLAGVINTRFGPRPADLDRPAWTAFQAAFAAWREKDFARAEALIADLPPTLSIRTLRGLIRMDRSKSGRGLDRVLYDNSFVAAVGDREAILEECRASDLDQRIADRAALADDLLEDDTSLYPLFSTTLDSRLQGITGQIYFSNAESQLREYWGRTRGLCTGERGRDWLTVRLWDAQCIEAAAVAAEAAKIPGLRDLAGLASRLESGEGQKLSEGWFLVNAPNLCLLPAPADAACLLHLDSPYMQMLSPETVSARLSARIEYIALLRRLREEYPHESMIEVPWLLALLAGEPPPKIPSRKRFERWWASHRASQHGFDGAFVTGLEAARKEDWARAEEAFAEASAAWPERTCAAYNRALALLHLTRGAEAEKIFQSLADKSPDEAAYWMRIGDARRVGGRPREALEAYRRAARLGGLEEDVALRLGMTLATEGQEDEAAKQLDAAAGPNADPERLEELAGFLEAEGVYKLAGRYREQAFLKRLGDKPTGDEDEEEGEGELGDGDDLEPAG